MTTQRSRHLQSELRCRSAPFEPCGGSGAGSTSRVGARSWASSEQWSRCHVPSSLPQEANLAAHPAPYRRTILARGCVLSATQSTWPLPNHPHDDGQVQTDTSAGPAQPAPASSARLRLGQTTSRSWTQRATTPTPAIPAVRRPAPPPRCMTSLRPDTADAGTHGHRTPDSGHLDAQTPAPDTGHRSPGQARVDTGRSHRTLDAGRGHQQGDEGTAGSRTSWATTPSDRALGRPNRVPVDGACGAPQPMEARR
jgi:hypothetical protein